MADIFAQHGIDLGPQTASGKDIFAVNSIAVPKPPSFSRAGAIDSLRVLPGGAAKGAATIVGGPGDIANYVPMGMLAASDYVMGRSPTVPLQDRADAMQYVGESVVGGPMYNMVRTVADKLGTLVNGPKPKGLPKGVLPTSVEVNNAFSAPFGGYYEPETELGKYVETGASFFPAALMPGSIPLRAARVVIPSVTSETAAKLTPADHPEWEPYFRLGGTVLGGGITELGPAAATGLARVANRGLSAVTGGKVQLLNPVTEAERRLRTAFISDGGAQAALDKAASFANSGASKPSVLDLGGGSVRRLVRASAGGGDDAHNLATQYADTVRADLQDNAADAVRRMTPGETRTAQQAERDLEANQRNVANERYHEPYQQPAQVTREMVSALQGPEGRAAIGEAYRTASARRDIQQMGELQDLLRVAQQQGGGRNTLTGQMQNLEDALAELSAGSLDRVRIAMRERGNALAANNNRARAGGYFDRVNDIDTALDQTPGLTDARGTYRQMQAERDAVPTGQQVITAPSAQYGTEISDLASVGGPPNLGPGLRAGARQGLLDAIERPAAGQTGVLNRIATGTGPGRNLAKTFGIGRTNTFRSAIRNEVQRLRNANFVSPETGSQTQLRHLDEGLVGGIPSSISSFVAKIADKFFRGVSLTPAERAEIVRLGTSEADLRRFATIPAERLMRPTTVGTQAIISQGTPQRPALGAQ